MCITEEEFREERKRAAEVLKEFKRLEGSFDLITVRVDSKTVKSYKPVKGSIRKKRHNVDVPDAERGFLDTSLAEFFEDPDCGGRIIF